MDDIFTGNPFQGKFVPSASHKNASDDEMSVDVDTTRKVQYKGRCMYNIYDSSDDSFGEDEFLPKQASCANFGAVLMRKMGYINGQGLGPVHQGILEPVEAKSNSRLTGLGKPEVLSKQTVEIDAQISFLQELKTLVYKDVDIAEFVRKCSGTKWWDELGCANVFVSLFEYQLSPLDLNAIEQRINVFRAGALLGTETWSKLLLKVWMPKLNAAGTRELEHVGLMLPYVRVLQPQLLQLFINPALSEPGLRQLCALFKTAKVYTSIVSAPTITRPNNQVLAAVFPNTQLDTLNSQSDLLDSAWAQVEQGLLPIADFMHLFLENTREKLANNTFTPQWYKFWKERVWPYNVDQYLLAILNLINSELDSSSLVLPPFSEILETYCQNHEYLMAFDGSEYEIRGIGGSVRCFIDKDVLFLKLGKETVPIALTDLDNLVG